MDFIFADMMQWAFWVAVGQIIWINILLSGDNAVVIALACRTLPPRQRFWGILLGAGAAVVLRIFFTVIIAQIMTMPYLKLVGGLLLLWIAVKLIVPSEEHGEESVKSGDTLWRAVWIVTVADIVMSLDNVIAIAAAAESAAMRVDLAHALAIKTTLIVFGLATSVPLIIAGSALLMKVMEKFPILVWAGAALLGWVAGEIIIKDAVVIGYLGEELADRLHLWAATVGAIFVVAAGWVIRRAKHKGALEHPLIIDPPGPEEFPAPDELTGGPPDIEGSPAPKFRMQRSTDRILTTHVGSLIRPPELQDFLRARQTGNGFDQATYDQCLTASVAGIVRRQAEAGIDVVSDGEFGKSISWSQYVLERLSGFERRPFKPGANVFQRGVDREKFPEFYAELDAREGVATTMDSVCVGPIRYTGQKELQRDIDNFKAALQGVKVTEAFMPVAAPASVIPDRKNEYYKSDEELIRAIGAAMRTEYKMIVDAGFILQLDDARAATTYDRMVPPASFADYRKWVALHMEVLNDAIAGLPPERIRYHVCWGSWPGPHVSDVPLKDIVDLILSVKVGAYVIEGANPRHEHEWKVWQDVKLPEGRVLIPGVISHATNVVEHPELVAERIVRIAKLVGRDNVIGGTDCGFAQGPFHRRVHPSIMWAKLEALAAGARLASKELWK